MTNQVLTGLDKVYWERNRLAAVLATVFPSCFKLPKLGSDDWAIVYIQLPTGQISFHIPDSEHIQFMHLPRTDEDMWDGHDDAEKWRRTLKFILESGGETP